MNNIFRYIKERSLSKVYINILVPVLAIIHFASKLIGIYPGAQGGTGGW